MAHAVFNGRSDQVLDLAKILRLLGRPQFDFFC